MLKLYLAVVLALAPVSCSNDGSIGSGPQDDQGASATLSWNQNTEPGLAGYKVYYGTSPGKYGPGIDVGNVTTYALTGLIKGQKYYITITAYTKSNRESRFSNEVTGVAK